MNRYAVVANGVVTNVILLGDDSDWTPPAGSDIVEDEASLAEVGGTWTQHDGFGPAAIEQPDVQVISAMQLAAALLLAGKITAPEARAFGRAGIIPPALEGAVIEALGQAGKTQAQIQIALLMLESATEYHRDHPLTPIIGAALDMDSAAITSLWRVAGGIR